MPKGKKFRFPPQVFITTDAPEQGDEAILFASRGIDENLVEGKDGQQVGVYELIGVKTLTVTRKLK